MESTILKIKTITTNKIKFDYSLMEFSDGIYNIKLNKFLADKNIYKNCSTIKYYNKSYSYVRHNQPIN
jgi:hypothetical protein